MANIKDIEDKLKLESAVLKGNTTPQYSTTELKTPYETSYTNYVLAQGNGPVNVAVPKATNNASKSKALGVDDDTYNKAYNNSFNESDKSKELTANRETALSNLGALTSKDSIISDSTWDSINSSFVIPDAVKEADIYIANQLEKIQSGKTSYSDQVKEMMDKIMNREKFSYDVDTDPLFQQALASAMNSGKQAMQDTIGQASALTGGYGSTYATTAGNQAYNAFIEDAYNNLPEYYQMALDAYQMEGEEMYRQYGMLSAEDDKEYNRYVTAYDATYQHRNQLYNEAYTQYRDSKSDAFATANLELNEHGQLVSDAYNYYNATADYADTVYQREYNTWLDSINIAAKEVDLLNSDAWANKNFDEGVRQYEKNYAQTEDHFTRNQEFQSSENQKQRDFTATENQKDRDLTVSENAKNREHDTALANMKSSSGGGSGSGGYELTPTEANAVIKAYNDAGGGDDGYDAAMSYLKGIGKYPTDAEAADIIGGILDSEDVKTEKSEKEKKNTPSVVGTLSGFKTNEGDNFKVTVGKTSYTVENSGKVTDKDILKKLKEINVSNGKVFRTGSKIYVKYNDNYYSVGATEILGIWKTGDKSDLLTALQ